MSRESSAHNLRSRQVPAAQEIQLGSVEDSRDEQWRKKTGSICSRSASAGKSKDRNPLKSIHSLAHALSKQDIPSSNDDESRPTSQLSVRGPTYDTVATDDEQPSSHDDDGAEQQQPPAKQQRSRAAEHLADDDELSNDGSGVTDDQHGAADLDQPYALSDEDDDNGDAHGGSAAAADGTPATVRRDDSGPSAAVANADAVRPAASQPPPPSRPVVSPAAKPDWDTTMGMISSPHGDLRRSDAFYFGDNRATFDSAPRSQRPTTALLTMDHLTGGGRTPSVRLDRLSDKVSDFYSQPFATTTPFRTPLTTGRQLPATPTTSSRIQSSSINNIASQLEDKVNQKESKLR